MSVCRIKKRIKQPLPVRELMIDHVDDKDLESHVQEVSSSDEVCNSHCIEYMCSRPSLVTDILIHTHLHKHSTYIYAYM